MGCRVDLSEWQALQVYTHRTCHTCHMLLLLPHVHVSGAKVSGSADCTHVLQQHPIMCAIHVCNTQRDNPTPTDTWPSLPNHAHILSRCASNGRTITPNKGMVDPDEPLPLFVSAQDSTHAQQQVPSGSAVVFTKHNSIAELPRARKVVSTCVCWHVHGLQRPVPSIYWPDACCVSSSGLPQSRAYARHHSRNLQGSTPLPSAAHHWQQQTTHGPVRHRAQSGKALDNKQHTASRTAQPCHASLEPGGSAALFHSVTTVPAAIWAAHSTVPVGSTQ
jgi:hypothetical protein